MIEGKVFTPFSLDFPEAVVMVRCHDSSDSLPRLRFLANSVSASKQRLLCRLPDWEVGQLPVTGWFELLLLGSGAVELWLLEIDLSSLTTLLGCFVFESFLSVYLDLLF